MELQLPVALQVSLYVASGGIVGILVVLVLGLLYGKRQIDRLIRSVEELRTIVEPLVLETRVAVRDLQNLTRRVQEKWLAVENMLETVRGWSRRATQVMETSATVVMSPFHAVGRNTRILMKGMQTFFQVLLSRAP